MVSATYKSLGMYSMLLFCGGQRDVVKPLSGRFEPCSRTCHTHGAPPYGFHYTADCNCALSTANSITNVSFVFVQYAKLHDINKL